MENVVIWGRFWVHHEADRNIEFLSAYSDTLYTPKTLKRDYYIFLGYIWISAVMFLAYIPNQYDLLIVF